MLILAFRGSLKQANKNINLSPEKRENKKKQSNDINGREFTFALKIRDYFDYIFILHLSSGGGKSPGTD